MQHAAALVAAGERQTAGLAGQIAVAFAGPAVADPAAHLVWVLFGRPAGVGKFFDHDLDRYCGHVAGWSKHDPLRWGRQLGVSQQVAVKAFERNQQAVEYVEAGVIEAVFIA